jgi:hypothetical protein
MNLMTYLVLGYLISYSSIYSHVISAILAYTLDLAVGF